MSQRVEGAAAGRARVMSPWTLLTLLWGLLLVMQIEGITPLVFSMPAKLLTTAAFLLLFGGTLWAIWKSEPASRVEEVWWLPLLGGFLIAGVLAFLPRYFTHLGYQPIGAVGLLVVINTLALAALFGWMQRSEIAQGRILPFLLGCWLALAATWLIPVQYFALHGDRSDMLPNIITACRTWLAGATPYQWFEVGTHRSPMPYLPALWILYAPFAVLDIDPRWMTPIALLGFLLIGWRAWKRHGGGSGAGYLVWMAVNPFLFLRHDVHSVVVWPVLALALALMLDRKWVWSSILWGILLGMRLTLVVLAPFYLVHLMHRLGLRAAAAHALVVLLVAAAILAPFVLESPEGFVECVFRHRASFGARMPVAPWPRVAGWLSGFSLVPIFILASATGVLEYLQIAVVAMFGAAMLFLRPGLKGTLCLMAGALLSFLLLNPLIEVYMFAPLLILLAFAILAARSDRVAASSAVIS
jgi:hypothetical protein